MKHQHVSHVVIIIDDYELLYILVLFYSLMFTKPSINDPHMINVENLLEKFHPCKDMVCALEQ